MLALDYRTWPLRETELLLSQLEKGLVGAHLFAPLVAGGGAVAARPLQRALALKPHAGELRQASRRQTVEGRNHCWGCLVQ